ncbi:hypothetical protein [Thioalkalivibrio sp. ALE9]|uniref:hypothetical protein n=1 Tax=Thioalkalivibrio sp. ALE9 TaxID=1158169 RepID=UPI0012DD4DA1|nr:hypothetical protein [Thioalkalivibrio sp. ALE9]
MRTKEQAEEFIETSRPAIEHLFGALDEYNKVLESAQITVEEIESSKRLLSELFMYRDQWSPNANHHYAQYMMRMEELEKQKAAAEEEDAEKLEKALFNIGSTVESMSGLAGAVLQIGKQALSIGHEGKPNLPAARTIGTQNIIEVVWEGRNHAMHWDEGAPRTRVRNMLNALAIDLNITIEVGKNNCLSILGALEWKKPEDVLSDLKALVQ